MKLILASKSPRRSLILKEMGFEFDIEPSNADERQITEKDPEKLVKALAELKAETIAKNHAEGIILGADTIVYHNGDIIGKAHSEEEAFAMLRRLLGKDHEVYTGLCALNAGTGEKKTVCTMSRVTLRNLDDEELNRYVKEGFYKGKAGSYNIDDPEFKPFVEKVDGCKFNIMGMSFANGVRLLKGMGLDPKGKA
jgi:MAF protein